MAWACAGWLHMRSMTVQVKPMHLKASSFIWLPLLQLHTLKHACIAEWLQDLQRKAGIMRPQTQAQVRSPFTCNGARLCALSRV